MTGKNTQRFLSSANLGLISALLLTSCELECVPQSPLLESGDNSVILSRDDKGNNPLKYSLWESSRCILAAQLLVTVFIIAVGFWFSTWV